MIKYLYLLISCSYYLIPIMPANATQTHELEVNEEGLGKLQSSIYMGDTIKWTNTGNKPHQIQSKSGLFLDSGLLSSGVSFEHTFKRKVPIPQARSLTNEIVFIDKEIPKNELKFSLLNEPIIISPRDSLFLKNKPFNILIFLGESFSNPLLPIGPFIRVTNIQASLDGKQFFNGTRASFDELSFVSFEGVLSDTINLNPSEGYRYFSITVDPNTLSVGVHVLNIKVKLKNGGIYEDTVRYTILD